MNAYIDECRLLDEQRGIILKGIRDGKQEAESLKALIPKFTTNTYAPRLQYDSVNTHVERQILANLHTQMQVMKKKAGFHPYIAIQDVIRNVFILVLKLPKKNYIFNPSKYRGDFASSNFARLIEMGAPKAELIGGSLFQEFIPLGVLNQPFGIIVTYDGDSDVIHEGALRPDQSDWIYRDEISHSIIAEVNNIAPMSTYDTSDINVQLKSNIDEEDIKIKLKDNQ